MKKRCIPLGVAVLLALVVTGCESDGGIAARTQEKSAAYAKLKLSEKRFIEKGVIAVGFTPDMVYMAMGHPTKIESKDYPEGRRELWTYNHYYPNYDAGQGFRYAPFTAEMHYQPDTTMASGSGGTYDDHPGAGGNNPRIPLGMDQGHLGTSIDSGGPPQGGSAEPADLQSFTFLVLFKEGKVARMGVDPNVN